MLAIKRVLFTTGFSLFLLAGTHRPAVAQGLIPVSAVTVTAARPDKSDIVRLRKVLRLGTLSDDEIQQRHPVFVVKIFARFVPTAAEVVLQIGSVPFPHYGAFAEGIVLRLHDPARLRAFAGQPIKVFRRGHGGEEPVADPSTLVRFPDAPGVTTGSAPARKSVAEVLKD